MTRRGELIQSIGRLESCFREKFGTPRQPQLAPSSQARLRIRAEFIPEQSLKGLSEFSHVWLLSYFHLNTNKAFLSTVHPPRLKGKTVGVFASRSPHRPSPIGLSLARLERVEGDTLYLSGIDLVDGTPILDVKPYIPSYDRVAEAKTGWTDRVEARSFQVEFEPKAREQLAALEREGRGDLRPLISQVLSQDLRNPRDKSQLQAGKTLEFFLYEWDVFFRVEETTAVVLAVEPAQEYKKARRPPISL